MNLITTFSNFICYEFLDLNLQEIEKFVYELEKSQFPNREISNVGGWQSDNLDLDAPPLHSIKFKISDMCKDLIPVLGINRDLKLLNMWANINRYKDFNRQHTHSGSILSGVLYIKCGIGSGDIVFENPNNTLKYYFPEILKSSYNSVNSNIWKVPPEESKIVLFPSWLSHYVEPNLIEKDRISLSFNLGIN